jgi:glucose-6-phosphate 1-dehydrogenase
MATTQVSISPEVLKASQHSERSPDPCVVVIFGASGDLT